MTKTEEQNRVADLVGLRVIQQTINPHVLQNELCKQLILMFYRIMQTNNPNVLQNYAALRQKSSRRLVVRGIITILGLDNRLV